MKRILFPLLAVVLPLFLLSGCSAGAGVAGQWTNESLVPEEGYKKVLVLGFLANHEARRVIENEMTEELVQNDVEVSRGLAHFSDVFGDEFSGNREAAFATIGNEGNQAVLVLNVLDVEVMDEYIRTDATYPPMDEYSWYGNFWAYYDHHYATIGDEGYYTLAKRYYIEANVYDVDTQELVWSGQTESYDPVDLTSFARLMSESIASQLLESDVVGGGD